MGREHARGWSSTCSQGVRLGGGLEGAQAAGPGVHGHPAQLLDSDAHTGELLDHGRAGHEGVRLGGHDGEVGESDEECRARKGRTR